MDTQITTPNPYRIAPQTELCQTCRGEPLLRCSRCRRPYCAEHAQAAACCPDCEMELGRQVRRLARASFGLSFLGALGTWAGLMALGPASWSLAMVLFLGTGWLALGGLVTGILRFAVLRKNRTGWELVEDARLDISPDGGERPRPRRIPGRKGDKYDMYAAAWRSGFNRVQGCA